MSQRQEQEPLGYLLPPIDEERESGAIANDADLVEEDQEEGRGGSEKRIMSRRAQQRAARDNVVGGYRVRSGQGMKPRKGR